MSFGEAIVVSDLLRRSPKPWHLAHAVAVPLRAIVAVGNDASARVLEKVGFDEDGEEDVEGTMCRAFVHQATRT
jgi:RimJ/RimL family protein N-acetyltransferase